MEEVFEIAIIYQYDSSLRIPKAWTKSDLTDEQRDQIYEEINSTLDPFHETLRQAFEDPTENGREACLILMDSSKFLTEKTFDKALQVLTANHNNYPCRMQFLINLSSFQWMMFFDPKSGHYLMYTIATSVTGEIVFISPASTTSTPRGGDSVFIGLLKSLKINSN